MLSFPLHDPNSFRPQEQFEFDATMARGNSNYVPLSQGKASPSSFPLSGVAFVLLFPSALQGDSGGLTARLG